jgi:hypothetical protein
VSEESWFLLLSVSLFDDESFVRDNESSNHPANIDVSFRESLKVRFGTGESDTGYSIVV